MSGVQQVVARIGQVQSRVAQLKRTVLPDAFARSLQSQLAAQTSTPTARATQEPLVGALGTNVVVNPGATIRHVGPTTWVKPPPKGTVSVPDGWAGALPRSADAWVPAIEGAATAAGIDPRLLASLVWAESGFDPNALSRSGAIGLTQLMPRTAEGLGVDPYNPLDNIAGGAKYLSWTIDEFGSYELGLAAYNAGPQRVRDAGMDIPHIAETQAYVARVMSYYESLGG